MARARKRWYEPKSSRARSVAGGVWATTRSGSTLLEAQSCTAIMHGSRTAMLLYLLSQHLGVSGLHLEVSGRVAASTEHSLFFFFFLSSQPVHKKLSQFVCGSSSSTAGPALHVHISLIGGRRAQPHHQRPPQRQQHRLQTLRRDSHATQRTRNRSLASSRNAKGMRRLDDSSAMQRNTRPLLLVQ